MRLKLMAALIWLHAVFDIKGAYLFAPRLHVNRQIMKLSPKLTALWIELHPEDAPLVHSDGYLYVALNKALYGLMDSGHVWYKFLDKFLHSHGYIASESDPCLYVKWVSVTDFAFIMTHVDDLFVTGLGVSFTAFPSVLAVTFPEFTSQFSDKFSYLGMSISREKSTNTVRIHQRPYIVSLLETFNMSNCKPASSPNATELLTAQEDVSGDCDKTYFLSMLMSIMYLARISRPDVLFPTTYLATKSAKPTNNHLSYVKRILRYLKGTMDFALSFTGTAVDFTVYADASHAIYDDGKGHHATVMVLGGDEVYKSSHRMKCVSLSSTEDELIGAVDAATYFKWLITLFKELRIPIVAPITLHQDNQSAIHMLTNGMTFKRTKHMTVKVHFVRGLIEEGVLKLKYTPTDEMYADPYTKPYSGAQLVRYTARIFSKIPEQQEQESEQKLE